MVESKNFRIGKDPRNPFRLRKRVTKKESGPKWLLQSTVHLVIGGFWGESWHRTLLSVQADSDLAASASQVLGLEVDTHPARNWGFLWWDWGLN
jgi:hypothetical protein